MRKIGKVKKQKRRRNKKQRSKKLLDIIASTSPLEDKIGSFGLSPIHYSKNSMSSLLDYNGVLLRGLEGFPGGLNAGEFGSWPYDLTSLWKLPTVSETLLGDQIKFSIRGIMLAVYNYFLDNYGVYDASRITYERQALSKPWLHGLYSKKGNIELVFPNYPFVTDDSYSDILLSLKDSERKVNIESKKLKLISMYGRTQAGKSTIFHLFNLYAKYKEKLDKMEYKLKMEYQRDGSVMYCVYNSDDNIRIEGYAVGNGKQSETIGASFKMYKAKDNYGIIVDQPGMNDTLQGDLINTSISFHNNYTKSILGASSVLVVSDDSWEKLSIMQELRNVLFTKSNASALFHEMLWARSIDKTINKHENFFELYEKEIEKLKNENNENHKATAIYELYENVAKSKNIVNILEFYLIRYKYWDTMSSKSSAVTKLIEDKYLENAEAKLKKNDSNNRVTTYLEEFLKNAYVLEEGNSSFGSKLQKYNATDIHNAYTEFLKNLEEHDTSSSIYVKSNDEIIEKSKFKDVIENLTLDLKYNLKSINKYNRYIQNLKKNTIDIPEEIPQNLKDFKAIDRNTKYEIMNSLNKLINEKKINLTLSKEDELLEKEVETIIENCKTTLQAKQYYDKDTYEKTLLINVIEGNFSEMEGIFMTIISPVLNALYSTKLKMNDANFIILNSFSNEIIIRDLNELYVEFLKHHFNNVYKNNTQEMDAVFSKVNDTFMKDINLQRKETWKKDDYIPEIMHQILENAKLSFMNGTNIVSKLYDGRTHFEALPTILLFRDIQKHKGEESSKVLLELCSSFYNYVINLEIHLGQRSNSRVTHYAFVSNLIALKSETPLMAKRVIRLVNKSKLLSVIAENDKKREELKSGLLDLQKAEDYSLLSENVSAICRIPDLEALCFKAEMKEVRNVFNGILRIVVDNILKQIDLIDELKNLNIKDDINKLSEYVERIEALLPIDLIFESKFVKIPNWDGDKIADPKFVKLILASISAHGHAEETKVYLDEFFTKIKANIELDEMIYIISKQNEEEQLIGKFEDFCKENKEIIDKTYLLSGFYFNKFNISHEMKKLRESIALCISKFTPVYQASVFSKNYDDAKKALDLFDNFKNTIGTSVGECMSNMEGLSTIAVSLASIEQNVGKVIADVEQGYIKNNVDKLISLGLDDAKIKLEDYRRNMDRLSAKHSIKS